MNLLLVERSEINAEGLFRLTGRRGRHLLEVLNVQPGQEIRAGVLGEGKTTAVVISADEGSVTARMKAVAEDPPTNPSVRLILALPRPKAVPRVIQNAACFGVTRIDLVNAWKVSKSYFSSPNLAAKRLNEEAILGAEQGGRTHLLEIHVHRLFLPFLETIERPGQSDPCEGEQVRLLAHPGAKQSIEEVYPRWSGAGSREVVLAIGPEGGWVDTEVASLATRGFQAVHLGKSILRSEVAVTTALAQIDLLDRLQSPRR
jgi:16S rRNA (uracil1498-N3)-methyltransferase